MNNKLLEGLRRVGACDEAQDWVQTKGFTSFEQAWNATNVPDYLTWCIRYSKQFEVVSKEMDLTLYILIYRLWLIQWNAIIRTLGKLETWHGKSANWKHRVTENAHIIYEFLCECHGKLHRGQSQFEFTLSEKLDIGIANKTLISDLSLNQDLSSACTAFTRLYMPPSVCLYMATHTDVVDLKICNLIRKYIPCPDFDKWVRSKNR